MAEQNREIPPGPPPLPRCKHCGGTVAYGRCDCAPGTGRYAPKPVGELANGDLVWPGPTYLIRIHGDPERMVDQDICNVIEGHYNVLARIERDGHA